MPTHEEITSSGGTAIFHPCDVTSETEVASLVNKAVSEFGRLDIMINNAGIAPESQNPTPVWDAEPALWDRILAVNAKGVMMGCKYASRAMKDQGPGANGDRGWIVNTGSILSLGGLPGKGTSLPSLPLQTLLSNKENKSK